MHMTFFRPALATLALSTVLLAGVPASAEMVSYKADLKASSEVPPNDSKAADLQAGRWYFNVHTAANRPGELRGQIVKK
jgi:hypothetical protein